MQANASTPPSHLPTLRPGQRATTTTHATSQDSPLQPSRITPSTVSTVGLASSHPTRHAHHAGGNGGATASGLGNRSRDSRLATPSTSIGLHSFFTSDGASHSISSVYAVNASNSSVNLRSTDTNTFNKSGSNNPNELSGSKKGLASTTGRLRFPPSTLPLPQQQPHQLTSNSNNNNSNKATLGSPPSFVAASAALPAKLDTPAQARVSHLEYTNQQNSLPHHAYVAATSPPRPKGTPTTPAGSTPSLPSDGLRALQDATTGLLVRHITSDDEFDERSSASPDRVTSDGERMKSPVSPGGPSYDAARAEALMKAAPFVSAALLDAGVDDRVNPFLLDKMIRQGRRQVAASAAAAAAAAASKKSKAKMESGRARPAGAGSAVANTAAAAATTTTEAAEATTATAAESRSAETGLVAETRYHEPPALQAAYTALPLPPPRADSPRETSAQRLADTPQLSSNGDAFAEILAEYANGEDADRLRTSTAQGQPNRGKAGAMGTANLQSIMLMSSPDYTRLASAASANDAAFIRQLVNYYTAHLSASQKPSQSSTFLSSQQQQQQQSQHEFSLLEAVLAVSREYVEVQATEVGLPGKSTAALSTRRRHLLTQLVTLDQTRIPESLWVTCAPPLSRLTALTSTAAGRKSPTTSATTPFDAAERAGKTLNNTISGSVKEATTRSALFSPADADRSSINAASVVAAQREESIHQSQRETALTSVSHANTIFPAARPMDRSQVYMLADVLDRMLRDPAHPQWVELLSNPEVARYVFAEDEERDFRNRENSGEDDGAGGFDRDGVDVDDPSRETLWGPPGEQRLMAYTDAAYQVLDILDTGLSELVRQVTCHCTERGALLDLLRQSVIDLAAAQVHVLGQVKQQARIDAARAHRLDIEKESMRQELETAQRQLAELQKKHEALQASIEPIQRKSDRLDELMARVASKARRFEGHRHDEHITLLQLLEESLKQTATAAVDNFYNEVNDMHVRHSGGGGADGEEEEGIAAAVPFPAEMPSVTAARTHAAEQKQTMGKMYTESHQLLRALQDTVEATNAVCSPLYKKMILADVSPVAKVATSKWATIARAVGAFEREKRHRQRVYEVFTEYCTVYRHQQAAQVSKEEAETTAQDMHNTDNNNNNSSAGAATASNVSTALTTRSHGESFLLESSKSRKLGDDHDAEDEEGDEDSSDAASLQSPTSPSNAAGAAGRLHAMRRRLQRAQAASTTAGADGNHPLFGSIITHDDLEAMAATDCTVEEVNALFRQNFDVRAYLRGSWEEYVHERQLQEAASGVDDAYTLRLPDLLQMLCDLHATLNEVTLRMRAMADSGVLQAILRPPLEPPAHPEQPCALCGRRDTCETDRQRRREAMSRIARDLQGKMDAVEAKSRSAQLERDEAKREVRRLQMELEQVSQGNMPTQNHHNNSTVNHSIVGGNGGGGGGGKPHASLLRAQNSSVSSYRRGRRDTSTPRHSTLPREPSFANASTRSRKSTTVMTSSPFAPRRRRSPVNTEIHRTDDGGSSSGEAAEESAPMQRTPSFGTMLSTTRANVVPPPPSSSSRTSRSRVFDDDDDAPYSRGRSEEVEEEVEGDEDATHLRKRRSTAAM